MNHHEGVEFGGRCPERFETWIVELLAADIGADHRAVQAELCHGAAQFFRGFFRRLHRQRGDAGKAVRMLFHQPRDLVVLDRRRGNADRGLLVIQPGLRRHRQHMHVHLGRIHVGEAALDIVAAAGKRLVRHAGDFED